MSSDGFAWDKNGEFFFARHKLSNGQYCQIAFARRYQSRCTEYYVAFAVANKKKNLNGWFHGNKHDNISCKMTGRSGVEALYWCRDKLLEFEKWVDLDPEETKVVVEGEDSHRFRLYERALSRYGYRKVKTSDGWAMVKFLNRGEVENGD